MINPNLVINIDREIGSKICRILSIVGKGTRARLNKPKQIKKILLINISEMGSTILAYPAIKALKKSYPQAQLYFLTFKGNEKIIETLNMIPKDNIFIIDIFSITGLTRDVIKVIRQLRKKKIDAVIDFELFSRFSAILGFLVNSPYHIGFHSYKMEGLYRGNFFTHKVLYNHYLHASLGFLSLVEALSQVPSNTPLLKKTLSTNLQLPKVGSTTRDISNIWQLIKKQNPNIHANSKLVLLNTRGGDFLPLRRWPKENFIKLAQQLLKDPQIAIVLIGVNGKQNYIDDVAKIINHPRLVDLSGKTTIEQLLALFNISQLLITHDSGPAHFAALAKISTITLFGPETPALYGPLNPHNISLSAGLACSPCINAYNTRQTTCRDNICMQKITVNQVFKTATDILYSKNS